jgi:S1-C subfamily serine protease
MSSSKLITAVALTTAMASGGVATIVAGASESKRPPKPPAPKRAPAAPTTLSDKQIVEQQGPSVIRLVGENGYGEQSGSAVVIDADEGLVLTNAHVVAGTTSLRAIVDGEDAGPARIEGQATCDDLAVVRLDSTEGLEEAEFGSSDALEPMDHVIALGYPTSLEAEPTLSATAGAVSKPEIGVNQNGEVAGDLPEYRSVVQHTALIEHGSSGGPLFNDRGEVVGINTLGLNGQAWAISAERAQGIIDDLTAGASPAYLGWSAVPIPEFVAGLDETTGFEPLLDIDGGLILTGVENGSPAADAELMPGDLVFELNGQQVNNVADVCQVVQSQKPGASVPMWGYIMETDEAGTSSWSEASADLRVR